MQMHRLFSEGGIGKKTTSSTPAIHTKPTTEQQQLKKNVPDIQPSRTHKVEDQGSETKKQIKGTKIVVNSVIEQNVVNPSENAAPKSMKSQVKTGNDAIQNVLPLYITSTPNFSTTLKSTFFKYP